MKDDFWPECTEVGCVEMAMWHCSECRKWRCCDHHMGHQCERPWVDDELVVFD